MSAEVIPFPKPRPKPEKPTEEPLLARLERVLAILKAQRGEAP